jgi:YjbE family integral membrane protein
VIELFFASAAAVPSLGGPAEIWAAIVKDFSNIGSPSALSAFLQVLMIDIVIAIGVIAALVLRVAFALMVTWLLGIVGLIFAGGVLLLWVAWRMYRDIGADHGSDSPGSPEITGDEDSGIKPAKSFVGAAWAVAIADVSMSLDNVLAVAGAAKDHPGIMIVGLIFAVALMGIAANIIAQYIERYRWIAWIGLAVIVYVSIKMIYDGWVDPQLGLGKFIAPMIGG